MSSDTQPLIETVTEPLANDAANRAAANAVLEEAFNAEHPLVPETMARLEVARRRNLGVFWHALLWGAAVLALVMAVLPLRPSIQLAKYLSEPFLFDLQGSPPLLAGLTEKERMLFGDPAIDAIEQKRRLHLSEPENPAYFAEYAQAWVSENDGLPPDYLGTATRIAPDNAFFLYLAAAEIGGNSIEKLKYNGPRLESREVDGVRLPPLSHVMEYKITDQKAYEEAMQLIAKAATLPVFESYVNKMIGARVRLLPGRTMAEFALSLSHAYGQTNLISLLKVADLLGARAEEYSKSGRSEEFMMLASQRDAFLSGMTGNPDINLVGELVHSVIVARIVTDFHAAAERLGILDLTEKYRRQKDAMQEERDRRMIRAKQMEDSFYDSRGSSHSSFLPMVRRQVDSPPPITESDLKPMRMAEHEFVVGLGVLALALVILLAAFLLFLFRFILPRRVRVPALRMAKVLDPADWFWVLMLGVTLPMVMFLAITRLTPLSGRDYGLAHFLFAFPSVHIITLLIALLLIPAMVMRWRLSRALAPFGFKNGKRTFSMILIAMLLIPGFVAYPALVHFGLSRWTLAALAVPFGLILCLIFADALCCCLGKPIDRIFKTTTAIAVLPAYATAIIALCLTKPLHQAAEAHWLAQDTLTRINPDAADLGAYEFKVAAQKRREIIVISGLQ